MTPESHRLLIVEDSETQALQLRTILEDAGYEVRHAASAEAALDAINRQAPDLIVLDYYLPGVCGDELCRRVRMNVNTRGIPVLMLTVEEAPTGELRGLESGADDYLSKSADPDVLLLRIRALLRKVPAAAAILHPADAYFRRARLLAIDDSPTYLEFLSEDLRAEGYTVETAAGGVEGLERLRAGTFDGVLVDLVMPDLDGIAVCRSVVEWRRASENPLVILMLTARETKEDMTRGLAAGADDFIGKSSDVAVLKARIRALLRRKFFQEENQRILEELKNKELEAVRARAEKEIAEARGALVGELQRTVAQLESARGDLEAKAAELRAANEELESFSYSVSHDLRAPLRHISGFVGLLKEHAAGALDEKGRGYLATVAKAAVQMGRLIDDLLAFSRMGRVEIRRTRVNLRSLVEDLRRDLEADAGGRAIEWAVHPLPDVHADPALLRQVLFNLLANAVKYTRPRNPARIDVGLAAGPEPAFFVRDNGVGFDPQYAGKLFGVFQRLHSADEFEGTGVGLALVRRIVERHGGRTWAEGVPDGGATFFFTLPKPEQE